jgi:hypothetical protein
MPWSTRSQSTKPNPKLIEDPAKNGEGNRKWLARHGDADGIILIGGSSLTAFRLRVAQSAMRDDMSPSLWSMCGILLDGGVFASVPLNLRSNVADVPKCNAIEMCPLDDYDDPRRFPNIAIIRFAKVHDNVRKDITRLQGDRGIIDLTALMLPWLGFVWGIGGSTNPLANGAGLPSAAFVETVFAMAGFELTPGVSSASSCPEALWQSAKWWSDFYQSTDGEGEETGKAAVAQVPEGVFVTRQKAAAVDDEDGKEVSDTAGKRSAATSSTRSRPSSTRRR